MKRTTPPTETLGQQDTSQRDMLLGQALQTRMTQELGRLSAQILAHQSELGLVYQEMAQLQAENDALRAQLAEKASG